MNRPLLGLIALAAALSGGGASVAQTAPVAIPLDAEQTIGDVGFACTGIGQSKEDARWKAYPVRLEFSNPSGDLLADEAVTVSGRGGHPLASVSCEGPWILMRGPAGSYQVDAWIPEAAGKHQVVTVSLPTKGLKIVGLRFAQP